MPERAVNTFEQAMFRDLHPNKQPKGTYRDSINGRLLFSGDSSFAWANDKGNRLAATAPEGHRILGYAEFIDKAIVFSTDGDNSEIGQLVLQDSKVSGYMYQTLFNDNFDPFGDKLNFSERIKAIAHPETSTEDINQQRIERIYWTDDVNPPKSFNVALAQDARNEVGTNLANPVGGVYPDFYSAHNMQVTSDFNMAHIEFNKLVSGSLVNGSYQYTYRLISKEGYNTPWIPACHPILLTDTSVNPTNWHAYRMKQALGTNTGKGIRLFVYIEDNKRYEKFEVAYLYSKTREAVESARIFFQGEIGEGLAPGSETIHIVDHQSQAGTPIDPEQFLQRFITLEKAKTLETKDNILFYGNIQELDPPVLSDAKLAAINIRPHFRMMRSDRNDATVKTLPFSHQVPGTRSMFKSNYLDRNTFASSQYSLNSYTVDNDYDNYKGTNTDMQFTGYFRGETYRVGILFYDKKGHPSFVQHIADVTMPEMGGDDTGTKFVVERLLSDGTADSKTFYMTNNGLGAYTVTENVPGAGSPQPAILTEGTWMSDFPLVHGGIDTSVVTNLYPKVTTDGHFGSGNPFLRLMGLWVDNIDVTDIKDKISGFSIVRMKRDKRLLSQGLLMPMVKIGVGGKEYFPLPIAIDNFVSGFLRGLTPSDAMNIRPADEAFTFESADIIMGRVPDIGSDDQMKLVGMCWQIGSKGLETEFEADHTYTKCYDTFFNADRKYKNLSATPKNVNDSLKITERVSMGISSAIKSDTIPGVTFKTESVPLDYDISPYTNIELDSVYHSNSFIAILEGVGELVPANTGTGFSNVVVRYAIANYIRPTGGTYGGVNKRSLAESIYESIGEFRPVNSSVLAAIDDGSGNTVFDGVEVWGGDCYLDYFDYCRHTPQHSYKAGGKNPVRQSNSNKDYGVGLFFPVESKFNHMIHRTKESYGEIATQRQAFPSTAGNDAGVTSLSAGEKGFRNVSGLDGGPNESKIEDFTTSALREIGETLFLYTPKPIGFQKIIDFPYRWIWSEQKKFGEQFDSFRKFLPADFRDLDGKYGEITASAVIANNIYSWQEGGFGKIYVNERAAVSTIEGTPLRLGTGGVFERFDYISKRYGCQHQFGLVATSTNAYWPDIINGKYCGFGGGQVKGGLGFNILSDQLGLHDLMTSVARKLRGGDIDIHGGYDIRNGEIYMTFVRRNIFTPGGDEPDDPIFNPGTGDPAPIGPSPDSSGQSIINPNDNTDPASLKSFQEFQSGASVIVSDTNAFMPTVAMTIGYNELKKRFVGLFSFIPFQYITFGDALFSDRGFTESVAHDNNDLYIHGEGARGEYYGKIYNSFFEFVVNDHSSLVKLFDDLVINTRKDGFDIIKRVQIMTDDDSHTLTFPDSRSKFRDQLTRFPLRQSGKKRARGTYARVRLEFENGSNKRIAIPEATTLFRINRKV